MNLSSFLINLILAVDLNNVSSSDLNKVGQVIDIGGKAANTVGTAGKSLTELFNTWPVLIGGLALVVVAVILWVFFKRIIENIVIGLALLVVIYFAFPDIWLHLAKIIVPTIVVTLLFGIGGVGTLLILVWFGAI
ncbi:MAG: hypothetical protein JXA43_00295 [Candidatus Diapherotrites archaeon]|nr:hypothetical protein [Candidatus Diapherotrites archaeon]